MNESNHWVCQNCEYVGERKKQTKRSVFIEIILVLLFLIGIFNPIYFLLFLIFSIIYIIAIRAMTKQVCPQCESDLMIPDTSPKGQEIINRLKQISK